MNLAHLEELDEFLTNAESITPERLEDFVKNTLQSFEEIKHNLVSKDQEVRTHALGLATKIQTKFEEISTELQNKYGVTSESVKEFVSKPDNFSNEEWQVLKSSEEQIAQYQTSISPRKEGRRKTLRQRV